MFVQNIETFKENFKLIVNSLIDEVWNDKLNKANLLNTIQKAQINLFEKNVVKIAETDEEQMTTQLENTYVQNIIYS